MNAKYTPADSAGEQELLAAPDVCKGIVYAAAGLAELYPLTSVVPKGLLPVYDKPLVYYALSVLMLAGIRRIALVTRAADRPAFERLLSDGSRFGIELAYLAQDAAGPAQSLITARDFVGRDRVAMVLADTLVYGDGLQRVLLQTMQLRAGATVFAHPVGNPHEHTTIELDASNAPRSIDDRPPQGKSNMAVTGLYLFDREAVEVAAGLAESRRGPFTLSDIHRNYLKQGRLHVRPFGRGFAWLDTSTPAALNAATNFIETIETTQGLKIACLEEIAWQKGFIARDQLAAVAATMNNGYGAYLRRIAGGQDK